MCMCLHAHLFKCLSRELSSCWTPCVYSNEGFHIDEGPINSERYERVSEQHGLPCTWQKGDAFFCHIMQNHTLARLQSSGLFRIDSNMLLVNLSLLSVSFFPGVVYMLHTSGSQNVGRGPPWCNSRNSVRNYSQVCIVTYLYKESVCVEGGCLKLQHSWPLL